MAQPTHYEVLSLPRSLLDETSPDQTAQILKRAYHRALLRHHPDKAPPSLPTSSSSSSSAPLPPRQKEPSLATTKSSSTNNNNNNNTAYTIDQIITAYTTLSHPSTKNPYDRSLALQTLSSTTNHQDGTITFQTGIETIDLDDLSTTTTTTTPQCWWYKSCRCGNPQGFKFGEADLEEAGDLGELIVGCQDCSLWLRVHFAVVEEDEDEDEGEGEGNEGDDHHRAGA